SQRDEGRDLAGPGSDLIMNCHTESCHGAANMAGAITCMPDARQERSTGDAFFAHAAIAEQSCTGTEDSEVMQSMDDRNRGFGAGKKDRGGERREKVVDMNDV